MFLENSLLTNYLYLGICFLFLMSFIAGYIDSIAGGAGLILVPSFLVAGFSPQMALGQEKLVSTIGTVGAIRNFMKSKSIVWKIVPLGIVTSLIGAFIGSKVILLMPTEIIYYIILTLIPFGLLFTLFRGKITKVEITQNVKTSFWLTAFTCFVVGFYDGFFGPGTGSIFIICLYLINKMTLLHSSATSKIFNFSSNIGAFISFAMAGQMTYLVGIPMIVGSLLGNHLGSTHAIKTSGAVIKKALVITVGIMLITLILKLLNLY